MLIRRVARSWQEAGKKRTTLLTVGYSVRLGDSDKSVNGLHRMCCLCKFFRYRRPVTAGVAGHSPSGVMFLNALLMISLMLFGTLSQVATAKGKAAVLGKKQAEAATSARAGKKIAAKPVTADAPPPAIKNETELGTTITAARARLRQSQDVRARDALGWAGITLAAWALQAEAQGDVDSFRRHIERIRVDLPDTGWRIQNLAERGWPGGWRAVGLLSEHGLLLDKDEKRACAAYGKAAATSPASAWHVAQCQLVEDAVLAWSTMEHAARLGHAGAQEWMGRRCLGDFGGAGKNPACAREWLLQAASHGRPSAQTLLAYLLVTGSGGPVDVPRGMKLYAQAAEKGDASAQNNLGESFETGRGVDRNLATALSWYERAADSGLPAAQFNAGRLLAVGVDGRRDVELARRWLLAAREKGVSEADAVIRWLDEQTPAAATVSAAGSEAAEAIPPPALR